MFQCPGEPVGLCSVPVEPVRQGGCVVPVAGDEQGVSAQSGAGGAVEQRGAGGDESRFERGAWRAESFAEVSSAEALE